MNRRSFLTLAALPLALSSAHGETDGMVLDLHGSRATLYTDAGEGDVAGLLPDWIRRSADAVFAYYGRFPVPEVAIGIAVGGGSGVRGGQTFPGDVPRIMVRLGRGTTREQLMHGDWVMVHEMIHTAFPWMDGAHDWMSEGIAVYVESIARVQAGHLPAERIWADFMRDMPRGLPAAGDRGIDMTRTWARTYWGGALFCLVADCTIRRETEERFGLQHALRAINRERDFRKAWPLRDTLALGDRATGRTVLVDQYEAWRETPVSPDLDILWRKLGLTMKDGGVAVDDSAPEAKLRMALTAPFAA
jgi:hypothetical protein